MIGLKIYNNWHSITRNLSLKEFFLLLNNLNLKIFWPISEQFGEMKPIPATKE